MKYKNSYMASIQIMELPYRFEYVRNSGTPRLRGHGGRSGMGGQIAFTHSQIMGVDMRLSPGNREE